VYRGSEERIEKLLSEADDRLYEEKAKRGRRGLPPTPRRSAAKSGTA
jgi:hypothetical protein